MKKVFIVILAVLSMFGCGKSGDGGKELYIFNWSEYMPQEVLDDFYKETGIKVIQDSYASNEEMYAKITGGTASYDILFPSADYQEIMIKQGLVQKLNKSLLPNIKEINPHLVEKIYFDKNLEYTVPYAIGATGIAVNKKFVKTFDKSYSIFERSDLKGKMTLLDDGREVITSALTYNGFNPKSTNPQELKVAKDTINKWKSNIIKFDSESFGKGFANEEFWVVQGYYENIAAQLPETDRDNFLFFIPPKGGTMYIDSMVIPTNAKNVENAHKFMNYIHKPEVYAKIIDYFEIPSLNIGAEKLRHTKAPYSIEDLDRTTLLTDLGEALEVHNNLWTEVKSGN